MKRPLILAAGVLAQICLGTIYAWGVLGPSLRQSFGFAASQTELIYGLAIGVFALGTVATGRLVYRLGPRLMMLISAGLFVLAYLGAHWSGGSYPLLLLFLGPVMGLSIAFGYVCPLSTAVAWYPQHKGKVTGLAVMGFGGGAFLSSSLARSLFGQGMDILSVFGVLGLLGGGLIALAALFLRFPAPLAGKGARQGQAPRILSHHKPFWRTPIFWALCASMFLGTLGGLVVIGAVASLSAEFGLGDWSLLAIGLLTFGNAFGRLLWGGLMDRLGSRAIIASFVLMTIGFACLGLSPGQPALLLLGVLLTGLQFGASLVLFATYTERYYGDGAIGRVYPWIFACYGLAALVGPWLSGLAHDLSGSYQGIMFGLVGLPLLGALVSLKGIRSVRALASRGAPE